MQLMKTEKGYSKKENLQKICNVIGHKWTHWKDYRNLGVEFRVCTVCCHSEEKGKSGYYGVCTAVRELTEFERVNSAPKDALDWFTNRLKEQHKWEWKSEHDVCECFFCGAKTVSTCDRNIDKTLQDGYVFNVNYEGEKHKRALYCYGCKLPEDSPALNATYTLLWREGDGGGGYYENIGWHGILGGTPATTKYYDGEE